MKGHAPRVPILITYLILIQLSVILFFAEGKDTSQEATESLGVMAAKASSGDVPEVQEFANRTNAEPVKVVFGPSNPRESGAYWLQGNNEDLNDSTYLDLMELVRTQYQEDLNYSSYILDEFVKKKIDARAAMTTTMTLFILTSETVDMVDQIRPPARFEEYQNTTQLALINLEGYLWNMVKFYETNRRVYAMQAHDNFNNSMNCYEKGAIFSKQF